MAQSRNNLLLLFERPSEPSFMPKGNNVVFDVPQDYLPTRFQGSPNIVSKFGEVATHVPVKKITLPDLSFLNNLKKRDAFSIFIPYHRTLAGRLITVLMGMRDVADFTSASIFCRDNFNTELFIYAYSVALLHRPDTRDFPLPPLSEIFPDKFFDGSVFSDIRQEANIESDSRVPIIIPQDYTASNQEPENRVAYFREDVGVNLHHWHWHLVYPTDGPREIVNKDRRGEIFYYMHEQIQARYNLERFSNQLPRVERFHNFRDPIPEGYFPKLDSLVASRVWAGRQANTTLKDLNREADQLVFDINDLERWRERFYEAIHKGEVLNDRGQVVPLTERDGIDVLGNMMESSPILSINTNYYGNLHGLGHMAMALCHDPDNRHLETFGVVGDLATSMRDPAFYRLHQMVDDIFQEHKSTLPRYTVQQLSYQGVRVTNIEVAVTDMSKASKNELLTFWQESTIDLARGMDFAPRGPVLVTVTHLQHAPFNYKISVENKGPARVGTVRIFLGPKTAERGTPMLYSDQRLLFIELDTFQFNLKPEMNVIERKSIDSSVTVPFERTFRDLSNRPAEGAADLQAFNFCGCGWPDHLLLPKGTPGGMPFELFVMVSDFAQDRVDQKLDGACADAFSFCGIRDKLYPDKRSMGFPFDRQPRTGVDTLTQFLTPNMRVQDITIRFTGERRKGRQQ